jgi:MFS family permease
MNRPVSSPPSFVRPALPRNVKVLGGASLLNDIASEMIYPLLPAFLKTVLGGGVLYLGVIEGAADAVASFLKLWSGGRSDQTARRKGFVLFGYSLAGLVRPLTGAILAPWHLLVIRVADRIGKGVRTSPRDALIVDSTDPSMRGRAFGFHRAMDHAGAAIGPLLAYGFLWLWPDQLRPLFLLTILPGLMVLGLLILGLRDVPVTQPPKERLQLTLEPFDRNFKIYLVALLIFTLGNSSDLFLLWRTSELDVSTELLPVMWCAFHVIKSTSNWLVGSAVDKFGPRLFLILGWVLYAAVYLAIGWATTAWEAWAYFLSYAVFYGLTEPSEKVLVANLAGVERKGLAYGWYHLAVGIATLPASLIFGSLYQIFGAKVAFSTGAGLAGVALVVLMGVRAGRNGVRI